MTLTPETAKKIEADILADGFLLCHSDGLKSAVDKVITVERCLSILRAHVTQPKPYRAHSCDIPECTSCGNPAAMNKQEG